MSIYDWIKSEQGQVFRYLIYKKVYTPYELDSKFTDESEFENGGYYNYVYITNAIEIPGDIILELSELEQNYDDGSWNELGIKHYFKLSEIKLSKCNNDNDGGIDNEGQE